MAAAISQETLDKVVDNSQQSIMDNALCLSLELSRIGTTRKIASNSVDTGADDDMIHISKEILKAPALDKIKKLDGMIRIYIANKCLPAATMFRSGISLIPLASLEKIDARLEEFKIERKALVNEFVAEYDAARLEAEQKLGPHYNPNDYPDEERVRASFSMQTRYITFDTPKKLKGVNPEIFAREVEKVRESVANCTEDIKNALRENLLKHVEHMFDKLSEKPDGSKKIFRDSSVNKLKEFLVDFNELNITNDQELAELVEKARQLMEGVDPDSLRKNVDVAQKIKTGFESIKTDLDTMLVDRKKRNISFED